MVELLGLLLIAWLVVCGFIINVSMLLHWHATGVSPGRVFRRAWRYGQDSQRLLDKLEKEDEDDD